MKRGRVVGVLIACVHVLMVALTFLLLPANAYAQTSWTRIWGQTAYGTMAELVRASGAFGNGSGGTVIIATGDGYWDALAASGLAGRLHAPVLITPTDSLAEQTREEIVRIAPERILVMGGPAAVTDVVLGELRTLCPSIERVYGPNAPNTATAIFRAGNGWSKTAIVATSDGYWDALSIAPYAYVEGAPIFLTESSTNSSGRTLSAQTLEALGSGSFDEVVIVGGPAVVSEQVEGQIRSVGAVPLRIYGQTAIETSAAIARWELGRGMNCDGLTVATSEGYWDALTGAAFCGTRGSVLVLEGSENYTAIDAIASEYRAAVTNGYVLGGPSAVPSLTYQHLLAVSSVDGSSGKVALPSQGVAVCIGDSLTSGKIPYYDDANAWPEYLQDRLDGSWRVVNLGVIGATLSDRGGTPYRDTGNLDWVADFEPAVVFIMLGTNDAASSIWSAEDYRRELAALVDEVRGYVPMAHVVLMAPTRTFCEEGSYFSIDDERLRTEVREGVAYVAEQKGAQFVDLYEFTKDHRAWFPDTLHPATTGNEAIATHLYAQVFVQTHSLAAENGAR